MQDVKVKTTQTVSFEVPISGVPAPTAKWKFGDQVLKSKKRFVTFLKHLQP